jgi:serine/threonine protein phosphatase PrpC
MTIVKAVGVAENANLRHRARMEDRYVVQNPLVGGPQESCYLAVYDGHGGREVRSTARLVHSEEFTVSSRSSPRGASALSTSVISACRRGFTNACVRQQVAR